MIARINTLFIARPFAGNEVLFWGWGWGTGRQIEFSLMEGTSGVLKPLIISSSYQYIKTHTGQKNKGDDHH